MVCVRTWVQQLAHNLWTSNCVTRGVTCGPCVLSLHVLSGTILHNKMHRRVIYSGARSWRYRMSCHRVICGALLQMCPHTTRCPPRRSALDMCHTARIFRLEHNMCKKKHFHDAKSWPLCCISQAPAPSTIALLLCRWLRRTHEVLNF